MTIHDARASLEAQGLHVSADNGSLWIAASVRESGGVRVSDDACSLLNRSGGWVAVFPAKGLLTYEVPGSLPNLVSLITAVYARYRQAGGPFNTTFAQTADDPEQYLVGRPAVQV